MYYYGSGTLVDGLYCFNLDVKFKESLFNVECDVSSKRNVHNDSSAYLWHHKLGHISKERVMRLMKNKILPQLDFSGWDICLDCIKGKQTKQLYTWDTDICGPFEVPSWGNEKYLITFIDEFARYCYLYLLHEKSQLMDALKVFIDEVER